MVRRHPSKASVWTARLLLVPGGARRSMEKVTFATGSASKASVGASNLKSTQQQKKQGGIKARDMKRGHAGGSSCKGGTAGALCTRLNAVRLLPNPKPQNPNPTNPEPTNLVGRGVSGQRKLLHPLRKMDLGTVCMVQRRQGPA